MVYDNSNDKGYQKSRKSPLLSRACTVWSCTALSQVDLCRHHPSEDTGVFHHPPQRSALCPLVESLILWPLVVLSLWLGLDTPVSHNDAVSASFKVAPRKQDSNTKGGGPWSGIMELFLKASRYYCQLIDPCCICVKTHLCSCNTGVCGLWTYGWEEGHFIYKNWWWADSAWRPLFVLTIMRALYLYWNK